MNKKGFTLAELLGVIVVLAIIITIAGTSVVSIINKSRNKINEEMEENLKDAAVTYALDNKIKDEITVSVDELKNTGLFEDTKGKCAGASVKVKYNSSIHDYETTLFGNCNK